MIIKIRTNNDLLKLLKDGISYAWRINKNRISSITDVEIFDFSGKTKLVGVFDKENTKILENGRVAVAFKDARIEQTNYKWVGQNPIKYEASNLAQSKENQLDVKRFSIFGFGREIVIGSIEDNEVDNIFELDQTSEDFPQLLNECIGEITERDNVLHVYGADMEEVQIIDSVKNKIEFKRVNLNVEPTFEFVDSLSDKFEMLGDEIGELSGVDASKYASKWNEIFDNISDIFNEDPSSVKFLISNNLEKGCFGEIVVPADTPNENIMLVSLTLEGMSISTETLIGYIIVDKSKLTFNEINIENASTETKQGFTIYLWDNDQSDTIWEGEI